MIESSAAYKSAIVADARRILLRAIIDISDPDIVYGTVNSSGSASVSDSSQLNDRVFNLIPYATLELNRWSLDGTYNLFPRSNNDQVGFIGDVLSDENGGFQPSVYVEQTFSNVTILQICSIFFPNSELDGVASDFTVEIKQGGTTYFTKEFVDNRESEIIIEGFTVNNPDAIRITVTKWSLPYHRLRAVEIIPGVYEEWDGDIIAEFTLKHQGQKQIFALI